VFASTTLPYYRLVDLKIYYHFLEFSSIFKGAEIDNSFNNDKIKNIWRNYLMNKQIKALLILYFIIVFTGWVYSNRYSVYHYGANNGLPSSEVFDVVQDNNGVMWFATRIGICSYDGYSWKTYQKFQELNAPPTFIKFSKDDCGNIYCISAYLGQGFCIYRFKKTQWEKVTSVMLNTYSYPSNKGLELVSFITTNIDDSVFILLGIKGAGIAVFFNGYWTYANKVRDNSLKNIKGIVYFNGKYLIALEKGVYELKVNKKPITIGLSDTPLHKNKFIKAIAVEFAEKSVNDLVTKDRLWIVGADYICCYEQLNGNTLYYKKIKKLSESLITIFPDCYGGVFVLGRYDFWYYNYVDNTFKEQGVKNGFYARGYNNAYVDFEKIMWFVGNKGADKLISRVFTSMSAKNGLLGDEVTAFCNYADGKMVLGHKTGITFLENGNVKKKILFPELLKYSNEVVLDIAVSEGEKFWFACGNAGLYSLEKGELSVIKDCHISCVNISNKGEIIVGTEHGIKIVENNKLALQVIKQGSFGYIRNIFLLGEGEIWCITASKGVFLVKEGKVCKRFKAEHTINNNVYSLLKTKSGEILVGTLGGLCKISGGKIQPLQGERNFRYSVYSLVQDIKGNLWMGTDRGVAKWNGKNYKFFSRNLGLIGEEVNRNAMAFDNEGVLWVGTNGGLNKYNRFFDKETVFAIPPKVQILSISNGEQVKLFPFKNPMLQFNAGSFDIKLRVISFINETQNKFVYRLNDGDWKLVTYPFKPSVTTGFLKTGKYSFSFKGINANGIESQEVVSPVVIVKRPKILSLVMKILFGVFVAVIGWLLFSRYLARKRAKELEWKIQERVKELEESNKKYRELFEGSFDGIFYADSDGKFLDVNKAFLSLFGYRTKAEALKSIGVKVHYVDIKDREKLLTALHEKGFVNNYCLQMRTIDKVKKSVSLAIVLLKNSNGEIIGYRAIVRDLTENEKLRDKLARAQKMEAIGLLAGGVAHDLNNSLAGLTTYPEILMTKIPKNSELRKPLEIIQKSGEKAAAMVEDLLTMARRGIGVRETLNINSVIEEYTESPTFDKLKSYHKYVEFEFNLFEGVANIKGSKVHINKCIMNLVSNAAESIAKEGKVIVKTLNCKVTEKITKYDTIPQGNYVVLSVSDNGSGISEQDLQRIFEPFYTKKVMGKSGTGLGMGVVWATVKDSKGYIDVISREGEGTTFELYFPATSEDIEVATHSVDIASLRGSEKLLVVDDIEEQRDGAKLILDKLGYAVTVISSGEKAVELLKIKQFDLILLDMIMDPGIDGVETYKRIKKTAPNQKVIIVSGFAEGEQLDAIKQMGISIIVKKPYKIKELAFAVRKALDG
jgi:PAS domain S-box-containing protein